MARLTLVNGLRLAFSSAEFELLRWKLFFGAFELFIVDEFLFLFPAFSIFKFEFAI